MKSTKVQTLGTVAQHATTVCTDDASIAGLASFPGSHPAHAYDLWQYKNRKNRNEAIAGLRPLNWAII